MGASSGIGEAFAAKLISQGSKVIIVGRRRDRLDAFVKAHGPEHATAITFDVTELDKIQSFADSVVAENPDLDCVIVNSGVQKAFDFSNPRSLDLSSLATELATNYTSAVYLSAAFLPHLSTQKLGHVVYVSATLGLIPSLIRTPNYNASKAALHSFIMDFRQQLKDAGTTNVRVVEIFPPAVQTELHDTKHQPDLVNGGEIGMPLQPFVERMYDGLLNGDEQFAIGPGEALLKEGGWEHERTKLFNTQQIAMKNNLAKYLRK